MSSVNHEDFAHLKIPLESIQSATNNFAKKNFWGEDDFGKQYVGQLLWSGELITIQVRRWLNEERDDEKEQQFWMEIFMLSTLKHKNLVSLVGFCDENGELITVIKLETRFSLDNYLSDDPMSLTWVRRLEICVGVAHALSYIHYDEPRDFSVIHRNIDSATILLNDNWEPKLSDFQLSMKIEASQRHHSFRVDSVWSTKGYTDPTYIKTNNVNHKSDMYSFGIVLFELLCGRESIIADNNNKYLAMLAITHYREKKLYDVIDPDLWRQMDPQSFNIFAETAYDCLNADRSQRPNIDDIVTRLEKALSLQLERDNAGSESFISAGFESHVTKNIKRVDAKYKKTGGVTHKSNVGLSEAMSGRSAVLPNQKLGGGLLTHPKKSHLDLPYARQVVKRLDIMWRRQPIYENLWKNLEHLNIALNDIKLATENFADKYRIGKGGYAIIYKAQLEHFDISNSSSIKGKNKCDLPKKCSTVAIKRIHNQEGEQGFMTEIEILTSCKHENIISLLGFCDEDPDHPILVYELASKGSLADYMRNSNKMTNLTWVQRLKICLDIAHGMNYIHTNTDHGKQKIIHRDIKSDNILLGDNWEVKISDFGHSLIHPADQEASTFYASNIAGTPTYWDPEYETYGRISTKSDIYSFGVLLLEILTGRLACDSVYTMVNEKGIAPIARDHFEKGTIMEIVDHKIKEETTGHVFSLISKGPNDESLDVFSELVYRCVAETQAQRPTIGVVIKELKKALYCQIMSLSSNDFAHLYIPLEDILSATNNFADETRKDGFANEYKGQLSRSGELINIAVRRLNKEWDDEKEKKFWMEISMLYNLKHKNLVSLLGFCDENGEKIIVNKHQSRGSLRNYLSDTMLRWVRRLEISVGLAHALSYIHYDESREFSLIHRNINSLSFQLDDDWEPKLFYFFHSIKSKASKRHNSFYTDTLEYTDGYVDPAYLVTGKVSHKSDIYSFGIVLFELLCGRESIIADDNNKNLVQLAVTHYREKTLYDIIDSDMWKQMDPQSFNVFAKTAYDCLNEEGSQRPNIDEIATRLEKALRLQLERDNAGLVSFISAGVESRVTINIKRLDAEYKKTSGVSRKSDVFSIRVVLSQVLSRSSAILPVKEERADRLLIHENQHSSKLLQWKNLEHLKIGLNDIIEATKNFDDVYCIGAGGFGKVYKADLEHFDSSNSSLSEGVDQCALPRKRTTVATKRIYNQEGEQGFIVEIQTLTTCKHENIISLLGFCSEGNGEMILVYEHASKGSLVNYLGSSDKMITLTWVQRLNICLDIAHGLNYIHNNTDHGKQKMIHRDIKSDNILLVDNWKAKIADFGLAKFHPEDQVASTIYTNMIGGTYVYLDPEYQKEGRLNRKSDIYSFGVVLLEILAGRLAYDSVYTKVNEKGIAPIARDHFEKGTIMEIVDPKIKEETDEYVFSLSKGPNKVGLDIFSELAFRCVAETQAQRPAIQVVINELKKALYCQIMSLSSNDFAHLYIPLEVILSATNNFADENSTRKDDFANEYKGQILWSDELINISARRLNKEWHGGEQQFLMEISMLYTLKHENLVSLVGFCDENGEKIIVNKHQTRGSLSNYLSDPLLTWVRRLEISVGLAHALSYIHYDESREFSLIHRDINSYSVLVNDNWEPKLCDFELSMKIKSSQRHLSFNDTLCGTKGYTDPAYINTHSVSHKSDLYSFGIVLFELLCSRKSVFDYGDNKYLALVAAFHYKEKTLDDIIDLGLRKQMDQQSLNVFAKTAYDCLSEEPSQRPDIDEIVTRLENALKLQLECQKTEHSIAAAKVEGTSSSHDKGSVNFVSTRVVSGKNTMSSREDLSHFKLSMEDIKSTTSGFALENIIKETTRGTIYKGRLLRSEQLVDIIGKVLPSDSVKDEIKTFWTEILMLSSLKHKNLVSLIGFYDQEGERTIIYKREANESLSKHLSNQTLSWMQRLKICVGVAKALSYIHYDARRDFSVIHCNIKSSKILLDDKWEPKLSGFEVSLKNTVARRYRLLLTRDIIQNVYMDPKYKKTGGVTHKSDVYSFGIVLFEVLCGRSAVLRDEDELGEGLLSQLKKSQLDDMIDPQLRNQMDTKSLQIFSETANWCVKEERADRPYIDQVVKRLEKALGLQWKHENPELPRNEIDRASSSHLKWKNLEHLKIALNDIELATENFADKHRIGSGAFGTVYKAQLEHFDSSKSSSIDGENKCDFPMKRSTVAIKHITNPQGEQGFNVEIETLTSCKHENIISLLGFCDEGPDHMILVYELASKGSLEDYLGNSDKMTNLTWMQRLKICLDIAHGLNYIHTNTDQEKQKIIHRDIKSANILLGDNWEAKIADFGLSKFHPADQDASTFIASTVAGTPMYLDPEYQKLRPGKLNKKSDIYSFGVVLFEILTGRLAHDFDKGIASIARHHFEKGTLMEIVDRMIKEETDEHVFSLSKGPNKESLDIFTKIAFQCLAMTQAERPSIDVVINELKKALYCQENHKDNLKLSLKDIKLATRNFNPDNFIGHGDSGKVYKEVAAHALGQNNIAAKRLNRESGQGEAEFMAELDILMEYKHDNVIGLVGYCDEEEEKVIVYKFASRGSLDRYLSDVSLTWVMRLKICIDIATGLEFLHRTASSQQVVIHRDISSSNILLFDDWKAKITDFGLSLVCPINQDVDYVIDDVKGTIGYCDPLYETTGFLTKESDIFSLGAVLFDILCGKLSSVKLDDEYQFLPFLAKHRYQVGKLDELVFEGIKGQIVPQSYMTFTRIAFQCLHHRRERRPTAGDVIIQLKEALEFQEDYEKWEPKLPKDYKEIIQMSKCPEGYSTIKKEDLYNTFTKGILLQQDKVLSFDGDGKRNELVSATTFTYINSCPQKWRSLEESRFAKVAEMSDISNLNIEIKTDTQLLSPNIVYGVYLVFKFRDSRKFSTKPMYVNLKYRKGSETLQAYFAVQRDENWMMIELYRFLNPNEDVIFKFLIESFSSFYCGDGAIHVEGIEFRAIDKVIHDDIRYLKEVQQVLKSNFNVDQVYQLPTEDIFKINNNHDELFWLGKLNGKKLLVLSAKEALYNSSNVDLFTSKPSAQSRFQEVIELLPQQVFYINCTFRSQMLSLDTEYVCYLVFKISEEYQGLHNPVRVRDLLREEDEEAEFFIYLITPSQFNIHDFTGVPKQREDGWMEIQLWEFNSTHELKDDSLLINMKFTSLEGMLSGLIVCGLEFRPM